MSADRDPRTPLALVVLAAVVLAACAATEPSVDPETAAPGAYSEGGTAFIVYPDDASPLSVPAGDFTRRWIMDTADLAFPDFQPAGEGIVSSSRVDDELRVWVDVAADPAGAISVAQLTIENRATDKEDAVYVDVIIPAFLSAAGIEAVPEELGLGSTDRVFDEDRTATVTVDGLTIYLAMNKWTLALGVTGG